MLFPGFCPWRCRQLPSKYHLLDWFRNFSVWRVSSYGRVQNTYGIIHEGQLRPDGYYHVQLLHERSRATCLVHRLVAACFLGPPPPHQWQVNHKDGMRGNNKIKNLEYVTPSQNMLHLHAGRSQSQSHNGRKHGIMARRFGSTDWIHFDSVKEAALVLQMSTSSVTKVCMERANSCKGFELRYAKVAEPELLAGEIWRQALAPDTGVPLGGWQVSSEGRVRSSSGHIHWGTKEPAGYRTISTGYPRRTIRVHRLVARTFLGPAPCNLRKSVNHIDRDPDNNNVDNLAYVSHSENMMHWRDSMVVQPKRTKTKAVWGRPCGADSWTFYESIAEAARLLNLWNTTISRVVRGRLKSTRGYEFRVAEQFAPVLDGEDWCEVTPEIIEVAFSRRAASKIIQTDFQLPENELNMTPFCDGRGKSKGHIRSIPARRQI